MMYRKNCLDQSEVSWNKMNNRIGQEFDNTCYGESLKEGLENGHCEEKVR
jgi:hypothetical protein